MQRDVFNLIELLLLVKDGYIKKMDQRLDKRFSMWLIFCSLSMVVLFETKKCLNSVRNLVYKYVFVPIFTFSLGQTWGIVVPVESVACLVLTAVQTGITP